MLDSKIEQYRSMARFVPFIFLGVAAFLLNLVMSRIVGTQRLQIATLKALGYGTGALRDALRKELARSTYVARYRAAEAGQGGEGVTVVWLT